MRAHTKNLYVTNWFSAFKRPVGDVKKLGEGELQKDFIKPAHKKIKCIFCSQEVKPDEVTRLALRTEVNFESVCRKVRLISFCLLSLVSQVWEPSLGYVGVHAFTCCIVSSLETLLLFLRSSIEQERTTKRVV